VVDSTVSYAVVAIPPAADMTDLELVRREHDPQFDLIPAHVTIVFPFQSTWPDDKLRARVEQRIGGLPACSLHLAGVTVHNETYVFLEVDRGRDCLAELHEGLHDGLVEARSTRRRPFVRHLTIGRLPSARRTHEVAAGLSPSAETTIASVTVCRIGQRIERIHQVELTARGGC